MSKNAKIGIGVFLLIALAAILISSLPVAETPSGAAGTSDQQLREEAEAIDAELQGLESDRMMIDQGLE